VGFLEGRKGLILGVANKRSVAWACARALKREGMDIALTYANARLEGGVRELGKDLGVEAVLPCDVTDTGELDALVDHVGKSVRSRTSTSFRSTPMA
jgi:enoyl-[acyl-carrier protein] reductase I